MLTTDKKEPTATAAQRPGTSSSRSTTASLSTPRTARFAEATAVNSPLEPTAAGRAPFAALTTNHYAPQAQPSDFGLNEKQMSVEMEEDNNHLPHGIAQASPLMSPPLKSALKTPGTAPKGIFSPTFHEEQVLEDEEQKHEKDQIRDLRVKTRVRIAKFLLRGVNFSCSLIVLSMLSASFTIFNATKNLPPRNINSTKFPPWAAGQQIWPQITLLVIACVSLFISVCVFYAYWRGGHRRAEKAAIYYTTFAVAIFVLSTVMWLIGAAILHSSKANGQGQDLWGWSCNQNTRASLFQDEVHYNLVCRMQNWSLVCCIIEIVVEVITIAIYGIVFYRFWSKRKLRKSMANRDKARSDLYLAQLRSQSAPNTPGLNPFSPRPDYKRADSSYDAGPSVEDGNVQYAEPNAPAAPPKPFVLQPPPIKVQGATPKIQQAGFTPIQTTNRTPSPYNARYPTPPSRSYSFQQEPREHQQDHFGAAPGEEEYESVPIPGAYAHPSTPVGSHFLGTAR